MSRRRPRPSNRVSGHTCAVCLVLESVKEWRRCEDTILAAFSPFVCNACGCHANDNGRGVYPSKEKVEARKERNRKAVAAGRMRPFPYARPPVYDDELREAAEALYCLSNGRRRLAAASLAELESRAVVELQIKPTAHKGKEERPSLRSLRSQNVPGTPALTLSLRVDVQQPEESLFLYPSTPELSTSSFSPTSITSSPKLLSPTMISLSSIELHGRRHGEAQK